MITKVEPLTPRLLGVIVVLVPSTTILKALVNGKLVERFSLKRRLILEPSADVAAPMAGTRNGGLRSCTNVELLRALRLLKLAASLPRMSCVAALSFCTVGSV